jgi:hypothetical protein
VFFCMWGTMVLGESAMPYELLAIIIVQLSIVYRHVLVAASVAAVHAAPRIVTLSVSGMPLPGREPMGANTPCHRGNDEHSSERR